MLGGFLLVGLANAVIVWRRKNALFSSPTARVEGDFRQIVVSHCVWWFAVSQIPAILGFLDFILTGDLWALLILVAVSAVSATHARPSLAQLEALERR